jgi:hypothetical protein
MSNTILRLHYESSVLSKHFKNAEEKKAFALWAIGDSEGLLADTPKEWNKRHGDLLFIKGDDRIQDTLPLMIELWKKNDAPFERRNE